MARVLRRILLGIVVLAVLLVAERALADPGSLAEIADALEQEDRQIAMPLDKLARVGDHRVRLEMVRAVLAILEHEQTTGAWPAGLDAVGFASPRLVYEVVEGHARIRTVEEHAEDWDRAVENGFTWTSAPKP